MYGAEEFSPMTLSTPWAHHIIGKIPPRFAAVFQHTTPPHSPAPTLFAIFIPTAAVGSVRVVFYIPSFRVPRFRLRKKTSFGLCSIPRPLVTNDLSITGNWAERPIELPWITRHEEEEEKKKKKTQKKISPKVDALKS
jgi:hypothetical protein